MLFGAFLSINFDNLESLHGKIYDDRLCIGTCVPFISQGKIYGLTCHHVFFDKNSTEYNKELNNINIEIGVLTYSLVEIITEHNSSKCSDVIVLELRCNTEEELSKFPNLVLLNQVDEKDIKNKNHAIVVSHPRESAIVEVEVNKHFKSADTHSIESSVEKGTFFNLSKSRGGAKEFAGISGSGLFISIEGNLYLVGLLSKLPESSIIEKIVVKRLDSLRSIFPESQQFSNTIAPSSFVKKQEIPQLKDVCFVHYTERSHEFYCERECDSEFNANINESMSIWLHGESGTGKTALVSRNLAQQDVKHIACDLEPITIDSCESIFRGMVDDITQYVDNINPPEQLDVKSICQFLIDCQLDDNTVVTIDEMSCSNALIIEEFCKKIISLVRRYQKLEENKNIIFVVSSIFHPIQHGCNRGKLIESFDFVCSGSWDGDIEKLFNIQNTALGGKICQDGKNIILESCSNIPRLLTKLVQKVYRSKEFSIKSVTDITERVISEYKEYA